MAIVIGIDGGGTKTLLAAARRDGTITTHICEAGCNPFDQPGWREVLATLRGRTADICAEAEAIAFGMPGYGEVVGFSRQQDEEASRFGGAATLVMNDVKIAFEGAFCGDAGVLLLAGTGSMAWACSRTGADVRTGGWGYAFGDEGSAFWIGRQAIARASRAIDGRIDAAGFVEALFSHLGLSLEDPHNSLIGWYETRRHLRAEVADLARFVDQLSSSEREAARILDDAADHLACHVRASWKAIDGSGPIVWSIAGGAFNSTILRSRVVERVATPFRPPVLPPIGGAIRCAAMKAGWEVDEAWLSRLGESLSAFH